MSDSIRMLPYLQSVQTQHRVDAAYQAYRTGREQQPAPVNENKPVHLRLLEVRPHTPSNPDPKRKGGLVNTYV